MILIISAVFPPEPVVSAFLSYDLALSLAGKNEVKVLTPRPTRPAGVKYDTTSIHEDGIEQIVLNSYVCPKSRLFGRMRESLSFGIFTRAYIKSHHSSIKIIYMNTWPLLAQYLVARIAAKYQIPLVTHIQDIYPESLMDKIPVIGGLISKILLPIDKFTLKKSLKIITISSSMSGYLVRTRKIQPDKIQVIYNWQDESPFKMYKSKAQHRSHSVFTFMYLGNLNKTASIDLFIDAFMKGRFPKARLVIAGSGYHKKHLHTLAANFSTIEFLDAPKAKVPEIQNQADVLLLALPRNYARFALPSKLIAYMFSEKPVIACVDADSEIAQVVEKSGAGWIVPPDDPVALKESMNQVISIPAGKMETMGKNGYKFATDYFSKENNLRLLHHTIESANE